MYEKNDKVQKCRELNFLFIKIIYLFSNGLVFVIFTGKVENFIIIFGFKIFAAKYVVRKLANFKKNYPLAAEINKN